MTRSVVDASVRNLPDSEPDRASRKSPCGYRFAVGPNPFDFAFRNRATEFPLYSQVYSACHGINLAPCPGGVAKRCRVTIFQLLERRSRGRTVILIIGQTIVDSPDK